MLRTRSPFGRSLLSIKSVKPIRQRWLACRRPRRTRREKQLECRDSSGVCHDKHAIFFFFFTDVHFLSRAPTLNHRCNRHTGDSSILRTAGNAVSTARGEIEATSIYTLRSKWTGRVINLPACVHLS